MSSFRANPYGHYAYSSHYPQATYPGYHPAYSTQAAVTQSQAQVMSAARQNNMSASGGMDTSDLATLNDALGSAGVDLRVSPIIPHFLPMVQHCVIVGRGRIPATILRAKSLQQHIRRPHTKTTHKTFL